LTVIKDMTAYWLYLNPYTFIFRGNESSLVYNTINGSHFRYHDKHVIDVLEYLSEPNHGYIVPISREQAKDRRFVAFVRDVRRSFSGDVVSVKQIDEKHKPFIFMPKLRLYNDVARIKKERGESLGELILRNLGEVTFFLSGTCPHRCINCKQYCKQFIHCTQEYTEETLALDDYTRLFIQLEACGVNRLNFVLTELSEANEKLLLGLQIYSFKKHLYLSWKNLNHNFLKLLNEKTELHVSVDLSEEDAATLSNRIEAYKGYSISWEFIVTQESDLDFVEQMDVEKKTMRPFYNGKNRAFFEDAVFMRLEDLTEVPISKKQIFRRQALNENFFGKMYVHANGNVYTNLNQKVLGNFKTNTLGEMIYKELDDSHAWLKTRDGEVCGNCVYRYLCPSISNYELVLGQENLCHIKK